MVLLKKKHYWAGISIIFLGIIIWQVIARLSSSSNPANQTGMAVPVAVEVQPVQKLTIQDTAIITGTLTPKSQFVIAPKISGRLEKLYVNIGDRVQRGQLLAALDDEEYAQQAAQAEADLQVARANLEESQSSLRIAERELKRIQSLHQKGIAADSELDNAKAQFAAQEAKNKVAVAQLDHKKAALKAAQVRLSYTKIKASWENGNSSRFVGERFVDEGSMLMANTPILSIIQIHPLTAVIYVTDKDYFLIQKGQKAIISSKAFPSKTFKGKIVRIAPLLKETSREARIEIELPNPDEILKPGMFISVEIIFDTHPEATVIPVSAIAKRNNHQGIFIADFEKKIARFILVKFGIFSGDYAEIIDPPSLSGYIVTLGHHLLEDGSPITLPELNHSYESPALVKSETTENTR